MILYKIALKVAYLEKEIERNKDELNTIKGLMKIDKYKKSETLISKFEKVFNETANMIDELEFYKNQFSEIERNFDIKVY